MGSKKLRALDPLLHAELDDLLHKESRFVEHFYQLIDDVVEPPFAISIDGAWGTGKTTVMQLLKEKFQIRQYPVFWFNPWKYSQSSDVVLAFLQSLARDHESLFQKMEKSGGKMFKVLLRIGMGTALKIFTHGNVSLDDVKEAFEKEGAPYDNYQDMIAEIEEEFVELANAISQQYNDKPLLVFFDDFDRCLPQDAIQLLEALKNLFVAKTCQVVFICGIDTRVAKNFIQKHYSVEETSAINYFRKIFNLTISMPYSVNIESLLLDHIKKLYRWDDPHGEKAEALAKKVAALGRRAEIVSVRKYLNIIHNFFAFQRFNPDYQFNPENDFVLYLQVVKEAWQPLYERIVQESLGFDLPDMGQVMSRLQKQTPFSLPQERILPVYFGKDRPFGNEKLGEKLQIYPALM